MEKLSDRCDLRVPPIGADDTVRGFSSAQLADISDVLSVANISLENYISMEMMRISQQRIRRLVLLNTLQNAEDPEQKSRRDVNIRRARQGGYAEIVHEFCAARSNTVIARDEALQAEMASMVGEQDVDSYCLRRTTMQNRDSFQALLGTLICPIPVSYSVDDALTPPVVHHAIASHARHALSVDIPDVTHIPQIEQPKEVSCLLHAWTPLPVDYAGYPA